MLSRNLVEIELTLGLGKGLKTVLAYTHVVEQISFSMFPSILTLDFDLILWSFLTFWGPNGLLFGVMEGAKNFRVYSYSLATFVFYVSFKSDF